MGARPTLASPKPPARPPAPAVDRAFRVLQLLADEQVPMGVSQIAAALGLGKATVHGLVHTLVAIRALEPAGGKKYRLGPVLEELARCRRGWRSLEMICQPLLESLAAELGQTAILGVPEGDRLRIAAVVGGGAELNVGAAAGRRIPLLAGAHGKVAAAWGAAPTEASESCVEEVRSAGVAFDWGEYMAGVVAAAAPVLNPGGQLLGVLYIIGLRELIGEGGLVHAGKRVRAAAVAASRQLAAGP